jgi:CRP-like cAMP-binding protein
MAGSGRPEFIYPEGIFGESSLIAGLENRGAAVALTEVGLMAWSREEIENCIALEPCLGIAFFRSLVRRCIELTERIESAALGSAYECVLLALVRLAHQAREESAFSNIRILSMNHQMIAEYLGTSREMVTVQMNQLRCNGVLDYSRKHIELNMKAVEQELRQHHRSMPQAICGVTVQIPDARAIAQCAT